MALMQQERREPKQAARMQQGRPPVQPPRRQQQALRRMAQALRAPLEHPALPHPKPLHRLTLGPITIRSQKKPLLEANPLRQAPALQVPPRCRCRRRGPNPTKLSSQ